MSREVTDRALERETDAMRAEATALGVRHDQHLRCNRIGVIHGW